jgi:glutamyl-tRNA reductase
MLKVVSLSHYSAPVEIRELIYLPEATCRDLLSRLTDLLGIQEGMVFSTCNRTEVYYLSEEDLSEEIIRLLCIHKGVANPLAYRQYFRVIDGEQEAVGYLFEVAMGLQSQLVGDLQISNQVKLAYSWANDAKLAGAFLHRLMHTIFHTNKRVQQETPYRDGAASVSYAAAELATELTGFNPSAKVLVFGLGEMGRDVARNLDTTRFGRIDLCNRTFGKAVELAGELQMQAISLDDMKIRAGEYDLILSAVSADAPFFIPDLFTGPRTGPRFMIDLSVPRSVAPEVESVPGMVLYNIDDIRSRTDRTLQRRMEAIPDVERIIRQETEGFFAWRQELSISPTIHKLKSALEQIRKEELARFLKNASAKEAKLVETVTRSMMNKVMRLPVVQLKEACKRGEADDMIDAISDLFDLEKARKRKEN